MSGRRPDPCCKRAVGWLKHHKGTRCFTPFTGQDFSAWETFVHAVELWSRADGAGQRGAILSMQGAVTAMQPTQRHMARDVIPCLADWSDLIKLWPQVTQQVPLLDHDTPRAHSEELRRYAQAGGGTR